MCHILLSSQLFRRYIRAESGIGIHHAGPLLLTCHTVYLQNLFKGSHTAKSRKRRMLKNTVFCKQRIPSLEKQMARPQNTRIQKMSELQGCFTFKAHQRYSHLQMPALQYRSCNTCTLTVANVSIDKSCLTKCETAFKVDGSQLKFIFSYCRFCLNYYQSLD